MKNSKLKYFIDFLINIKIFMFKILWRIFLTDEQKQSKHFYFWNEIISLTIFNLLTFYYNFLSIC